MSGSAPRTKRSRGCISSGGNNKIPPPGQGNLVFSDSWRVEVQGQGFGGFAFQGGTLSWLLDGYFLPQMTSSCLWTLNGSGSTFNDLIYLNHFFTPHTATWEPGL